MVRVYGMSDDLVEIEGAEYPYDEVGCFDSDVRIWFDDGTVIRVGYGKPNLAFGLLKSRKKEAQTTNFLFAKMKMPRFIVTFLTLMQIL